MIDDYRMHPFFFSTDSSLTPARPARNERVTPERKRETSPVYAQDPEKPVAWVRDFRHLQFCLFA
jgi:hypothetical protein